MPVPIHTLSVFQRPKEGSGFIKRSIALNYKHTIAAQGGFDTASCDIAVRSQGEGQDWLNNYLGCFVQAFADDPITPIWEGLINRITLNSGGISYTISLDELANRVTISWSNGSVSPDAFAVGTTANSTTSQALYGIKEATIEFGFNKSNTSGHPNALRDTIIAQRAFPQTSISQGGGNTNLVSLEMIGIFHTMEWQLPTAGTSASQNLDAQVTTIMAALANGNTFFDNSDTSKVIANAILTPSQKRAQSYWETIQKIAEAGDGTNYWVAFITPTDWNTKKRILRYQIQNAATVYTARSRDGLRIRNLYGQIVPPWTVKPDCGVLVTDVLIGFNSAVTTDPRLTYIFSVQYDANLQTVQYFGADDTTAKGAFMLKRGFKPYGRSFGAGLRTTVG